jgi:hypothetical protein
MKILPFFYYVFESKYGELSIELLKEDSLEYKAPKDWGEWEEDESNLLIVEG